MKYHDYLQASLAIFSELGNASRSECYEIQAVGRRSYRLAVTRHAPLKV